MRLKTGDLSDAPWNTMQVDPEADSPKPARSTVFNAYGETAAENRSEETQLNLRYVYHF